MNRQEITAEDVKAWTFIETLDFEEQRVAVAIRAGAKTEEIAQWLSVSPQVIAERQVMIEHKHQLFSIR